MLSSDEKSDIACRLGGTALARGRHADSVPYEAPFVVRGHLMP